MRTVSHVHHLYSLHVFALYGFSTSTNGHIKAAIAHKQRKPSPKQSKFHSLLNLSS